MDIIKVTIITVVFNEVRHIEQAIKSIIKQTYPNIEYIIVDGFSSDGTLDVIKSYSSHIDHLISEKDIGMYDAINKGIRQSSGEIIGILNSNDWYESNTVETVVKEYQKHPNASVFHGLLRFYDLNDEKDSITGHYPNFLAKGMLEHPTCFLKKEVYDVIGLFDVSYRSASDYDFMLKVWRKGLSFCFIPQILANHRRGGMSSSFSGVKETINIRRKYNLISRTKAIILWIYYWLIYKIK